MEGMAVAEAASGAPARAIALLAAADALRAAAGAPAWPAERLALDRVIEDARATVGEAGFETAWQAGRALSSTDALVYAHGA